MERGKMSRSKHVLIIVQNLPVPFDRRVWQEATSLQRGGFDVSVICPKKKIYTQSYERLADVDIYRYPMLYDADKAAIGFAVEFVACWLATLFLALKIFVRKPFHVIHACNPPDTYFALSWLFRPFGVKFIFDHHDLCPEMYVAKGKKESGLLYSTLLMLERLTLRTAHRVIAVNTSHKDLAEKRAGISASKITVVRSGPRRDWASADFKKNELKRGKSQMIVFLGEMGSQDGVDHLLKAIRHYVDHYTQDVMFTLIGGGPEQGRMVKMAEELEINPWTHFTGRISNDVELREYLATADLCVAPDPYTNYGDMSTANKIIEYIAFGKAVVAYDLKEHRRTAEDAALYVESNSPIALSEGMNALMADPARRAAMGEIGLERFRTGLCWEVSEQSLLKMYRDLLLPQSSVPKA
jgi:glycosyltransferase involved in cell wall biosynthesis